MNTRLERLSENLKLALGNKLTKLTTNVGEITIECKASDLLTVCTTLRDHPGLEFKQLMDLCGVDYADYGEGGWHGLRFAVVYHFLSISLNQRVRLKVFAADDDFPVLATVVELWSVANWFEREAFDLYGIMFDGHPDLRRLLTDYGFVGHPFRKDFPMIGNVEMRYDPEQQRVIYQPVSIEMRNNVPRIIRDEGFHNG
ncbi:MAG: NADH-quinone oxidoreductase subunit C [Methylophilaceae bacterium]